MLVVMSTCNQEEWRPSYRRLPSSKLWYWDGGDPKTPSRNEIELHWPHDKHPRYSPLRTRGRFFAGWDGETRWQNEIYKKVRTGNQNPTTGEANLRCGLTAIHIRKPNRTKTKADNTKPTTPNLWQLHVPRNRDLHAPPRYISWHGQEAQHDARHGVVKHWGPA